MVGGFRLLPSGTHKAECGIPYTVSNVLRSESEVSLLPPPGHALGITDPSAALLHPARIEEFRQFNTPDSQQHGEM